MKKKILLIALLISTIVLVGCGVDTPCYRVTDNSFCNEGDTRYNGIDLDDVCVTNNFRIEDCYVEYNPEGEEQAEPSPIHKIRGGGAYIKNICEDTNASGVNLLTGEYQYCDYPLCLKKEGFTDCLSIMNE